MDIEGLIRELGPVDASALTETVLAQEEAAWHEDDYRQETYDVHRQTESIVLVFTPLEGWPEIDIHKEPGWDRLARVAIPLMHRIDQGRALCALRSKLRGFCRRNDRSGSTD